MPSVKRAHDLKVNHNHLDSSDLPNKYTFLKLHENIAGQNYFFNSKFNLIKLCAKPKCKTFTLKVMIMSYDVEVSRDQYFENKASIYF